MIETKLDGKSNNIILNNICLLKEIFPDVFNDDKIDFEKLKLDLGEYVEDSCEKYNFTWPGKSQAIRESQKQSTGTLRPCKDESKNWDTTRNLYIEGDNLEVLKLLQKYYFNKIKMIYIDPPYNTGNDFVYNDDYNDNLDNYLKITNNYDLFSNKNSGSNGRYHTKWLNMMYPRLKLARNLLKDSGIIFISIDEHEISNLRKICDEIFGEINCIGEVIRKTKSMTGDSGYGFNLQHEYLLIYAKNITLTKLFGEEKEFSNYSNPDNDENGDWCLADPSAKSGGDSTYFPINNPYTNKVDYPPKGRYWAFSKSTLERYIDDGKLQFKKQHKETERGFIFKRYKKDVKDKFNPVNSLFSADNEFLNEKGTVNLKELFDFNCFDYPKPVIFIKKLIQYCSSDNDIILDFFSGSSTTAQAIMELNSRDNFNRRFLLIQLPENFDEKSENYKNGFETICEIGKERIRLAGDKIVEESKNKNLDIGFKVFKLDSSNLEKWDPDYNNIQQSLTVDNIKEDRTNEDLVYEIMLKYGIDLTLPIDKQDNIYSIGFGALIVCLEDNITKEIANDILDIIKDSTISRVVFKDSGFASDADKTNIKEILKVNNVSECITI